MSSQATPKEELDDKAVVRLVQSGDKAAFEILIRRHQGKILNLCFRLLGGAQSSKELAADIFAEAFRSLGNFKGHSEFGTWLYRIGLNQTYAFLRRTVRKRSFEEVLKSETEDPSRSEAIHPLDSMALAEKRFNIRRVLATLSKDHAEILILHDVEGLSYEEVSELARLPMGTVMSRLSRAREAFRKKWSQTV